MFGKGFPGNKKAAQSGGVRVFGRRVILEFIDVVHFVRLYFEPGVQKLSNVESVSLVVIGQILVIRMLRDVVFIGEERPHAPKLEDALASVEDGKLIHRHKLLARLLVIDAVAALRTARIALVEQVDGFFAEHFGQVFQGGLFFAAEKQRTVAVADDGVHIILVDGFEL